MKNADDIAGARMFLLRAAGKFPRGVSAMLLASACNTAGIMFAEDGADSLLAQLNYLEGVGLMQRVASKISGGMDVWRVTAAGDDYLRKG